ncbi:hypothetical protein OG909_24780 [Streptomyces sp. NBC_01754]|uniref:hypothetical protein n=1 Tax=Streptomyces sp. NBC_01754 TaxID=2975930 RepID=UPI002DDA0918|nr:hypothetical protein [Streptomyces sp. NBC_01754]WSC95231.1 hypothetical protein OG909_24780 [Streptomyces sp. NBC_01754]
MRTRHTTAATLGAALLLAVTGCSSDTTDPKPTASPTLDVGQACSDAVYEQLTNGVDLGDDQPKPAACERLADDEYLDTLLAVTQLLNKAARDQLEQDIEDAATADE